MPPITALLHCSNDALRLGRTLEMLLPCSEILVIDHHSSDRTKLVAHHYGARVLEAEINSDADQSIYLASHDWILCMHPGESITESLQACLFEFSALAGGSVKGAAFAVFVREQAADGGWQESPQRETRLVPRGRNLWRGGLPADEPSAAALEGELLRFVWP